MPFNEFFGVGRDPRYLGGLKEAVITISKFTPVLEETTTTISDKHIFAAYVIVSVTAKNEYPTPSEPTVNLAITLGNEKLAQYVLPTGQVGQVLYETVNVGTTHINPNALKVNWGYDAVFGGDRTYYDIKVTLFYKEN